MGLPQTFYFASSFVFNGSQVRAISIDQPFNQALLLHCDFLLCYLGSKVLIIIPTLGKPYMPKYTMTLQGFSHHPHMFCYVFMDALQQLIYVD